MHPRVVITLAPADLERERPNLERGSVVGPAVAGLGRGAFCDVELVFPSRERMNVPARVVLTGEASTVFAFDAFDREALGRHLAAPAPGRDPAAPAAGEEEHEEEDEEEDEEREAAAPSSVQERLRGLSVAEQLRAAREGDHTERVVLERLYGKIVWETLLRNPRVTVPEVSRLARMGTLPRPLLELILGNAAWLQVPQVRRALLSNPRLSQDMVHKVLQLLSRDELKLVPQVTAYPGPVRMAAKAMSRR